MNANVDQGPSGPERLGMVLRWLVFLSSALAVSVEVFLHRSRSFGERYIGLQAAAVLLIVPFYSVFWEGYDARPLLYFLGLFLLMCFVVRVGVATRRQDVPREHTRYTGYPRVLRLIPKLSERTAKMVVEPVLVFFSGVLMEPVSRPLGGYLMVASVGLAVWVHVSVGYERSRALDMHDAYVEQRHVAERFRDMRRS